MTTDNFGAESEASSLVTAIYVTVNCLDIVQVRLSALNSIVNKLPCPKCQGEFLKGPVANIADLFNAGI